MKQNEFFIFPSDSLDPQEIDLLNPENYPLISPNMFRVQSISSKYYIFNHHLETKNADGNLFKNFKELSGITYNFLQTTSSLSNIIKIRINHLGKVVQLGEY
jgi:CRISPR-associated endonuclease Csn1